MGCCGGRDKEGGENEGKKEMPVVLARESYQEPKKCFPAHRLPSRIPSSRFDDIETYALSLLTSSTSWVTDLADGRLTIRYLEVPFTQSSKFSPSVRSVCCTFELTPKVDHGLLLEVMEKESIRKKWDSKVSELMVKEEDDGTRVVTTKFSQVLFTRTLVEKRVNRFFPDELRVIYYTPGEPDPKDTKSAHTYFGFHRFENKGDLTIVTLFSQTDYRLPSFVLNAMQQVKKEASRWFLNFRSEAIRLRGAH